jgi:hypothetical protein
MLRRVQGEILELVELSLDVDLTSNALRICFPADIIRDVVFYEGEGEDGVPHLYIIVATSLKTLHRFEFDHPLQELGVNTLRKKKYKTTLINSFDVVESSIILDSQVSTGLSHNNFE